MAGSTAGYIRVHRRIQEHPYWHDPERLRAWLDCLLMAAWRPHRRLVGTHQVDLERGEFIASDRFLAKRWGWSRGKVRRFLKAAQEANEIEPRDDTSDGTIYLVVKYDTYQDGRATNGTTNGPAPGPPPDQIEGRDKKGIENTPTPKSPPSDDPGGQGEPDELEKWFEDVFKPAYPKRNGRYRWARSLRRLRARLKEGYDRDEILGAVKRYARWCEVTRKLNTETVMQAATFLGQELEENLANPWAPPAEDPRRFDNEPHPDSEAARVKARGPTAELPVEVPRPGRPKPVQRDLQDVDPDLKKKVQEWARENRPEALALWQQAEDSTKDLADALRRRGADEKADAMVEREFYRLAANRAA